jgi:hypothetical protein
MLKQTSTRPSLQQPLDVEVIDFIVAFKLVTKFILLDIEVSTYALQHDNKYRPRLGLGCVQTDMLHVI